MTPIQRFDSAAKLNIHLHCLVLHGWPRRGDDGEPVFIEAGVPTDDELRVLLQTLITRLMNLRTRHGVLAEGMGQTSMAEPDADGDEARTLRPLQGAAVTYRIALGPCAGHKVLSIRGAMPREGTAGQLLSADIDRFGLNEAVRVEANDRGWSSGAARSPGRRCRTSGSSSTPPAGGVQAHGAAARRARSTWS